MEFLKDNIMLILVGSVVVGFIIRFVLIAMKVSKIKKEGLETEGVVSRVEYDPGDENNSSNYYIYVKFRDEQGVEHESTGGIYSTREYNEGDKVRIKYLPGDYEFVKIL